MKAYWKRSVTIALTGFIFSCSILAQTVPQYELGAGIGAFVYQGDLSPSRLGSFRTLRPGLNLQGTKIMSQVVSVRANLAFSKLTGDESKFANPEYRQQRSFKFTSPLIEASALLVWDVMGRNYRERYKTFSPYVFAGAGLSYVNIKRDWSAMNTEIFGPASEVQTGLTADAAQRLPRLLPVIPVGAGLRYDFSHRFAASLETSYRITFTDYLDGFSKAANPKKNDHYHSTTLGLIYKVGKKNTMGCPAISNF
jgi:Domain of unknown function (DUF6089)